MDESNTRRKSLDPSKLHRNSDGNLRIHLQSTKANCRNRSLISTTDSLKLYEDQIVIRNPILKEIDEASLQKRPLSLCFDLSSSGEEVNNMDRSSTLSSMSSSSSSSNNSKYGDGPSGNFDYDQFLEDELDKGNKPNISSEDFDEDRDRYSCLSSECSSKDSVITVIAKEGCNCGSSEVEQLGTHMQCNCDCVESLCSMDRLSTRKPLSEQSYDLNSPDDIDFNRIEIVDNEVSNNNKALEYELPTKEIQEIIKIFNSNSVGMRIFEDNSKSIICTVKIFINLSEPVRMGSHAHIHNPKGIVSDKTLFPRGGFELVNIDRSTTCKDIIEHLFEKFHIQENYCKYGLFEHTAKLKEKDYLKRFGYDFSVFNHLINMVRIENQKFTTHFHCKRFVLQENEKAQINWSTFSISELSNFLRILEKEEKERKEKILNFYSELANMIESQMKLILP